MTNHSFSARFASELANRVQNHEGIGSAGDVAESFVEETGETLSGNTEGPNEPIDESFNVRDDAFERVPGAGDDGSSGGSGLTVLDYAVTHPNQVVTAVVVLIGVYLLAPALELLTAVLGGTE